MITLYESLLDDEEEILAQADDKFGLLSFWENISSKNDDLKRHWQVAVEDDKVYLKPTRFSMSPWRLPIEGLTIKDFSFKEFCEKIDVILIPPAARLYLRIEQDSVLDFAKFPKLEMSRDKKPYDDPFEFRLVPRCSTTIKNLNSDIFPKYSKVAIEGDKTNVNFENLNWKGDLSLYQLIINEFKNCSLDQKINAATCQFNCKTLPDIMIQSIIRSANLRLVSKSWLSRKSYYILDHPTYERGVVIIPETQDPGDSINLDDLYKYRNYFKEIDCNGQSISVDNFDMLPLLKNASEYVFWDAERVDNSKYKFKPRHIILKHYKIQKANIVLDDSNDNADRKYFQDYSSLVICTDQGLDKITSNCRTVVLNQSAAHGSGFMDLCNDKKSLTNDELDKIIPLKNFPKAKSIVVSTDVGIGWWNRKLIGLNKFGNKWSVVKFKK